MKTERCNIYICSVSMVLFDVCSLAFVVQVLVNASIAVIMSSGTSASCNDLINQS